MVTIRRLHDKLERTPFDYKPINNRINSQTLSNPSKSYINVFIIKNATYQAKLHLQRRPDTPPRAALSGGTCTARTSDSDHLRWSRNFTGNNYSIRQTTFITGPKSKDGRKWPEITSQAVQPSPDVFPPIAAFRRWFPSGLVALTSWGCGLPSPSGGLS